MTGGYTLDEEIGNKEKKQVDIHCLMEIQGLSEVENNKVSCVHWFICYFARLRIYHAIINLYFRKFLKKILDSKTQLMLRKVKNLFQNLDLLFRKFRSIASWYGILEVKCTGKN